MPYSISWYIENEIIYSRFTGETTPEELQEQLADLKRLIASSPRELVHVINDSREVEEALSPKATLDVIRKSGFPERLGWTMVITKQSSLHKMAAALATSLFKIRTRFFDTVDEAQAFLKDIDSTINWEQADTSIFVD